MELQLQRFTCYWKLRTIHRVQKVRTKGKSKPKCVALKDKIDNENVEKLSLHTAYTETFV